MLTKIKHFIFGKPAAPAVTDSKVEAVNALPYKIETPVVVGEPPATVVVQANPVKKAPAKAPAKKPVAKKATAPAKKAPAKKPVAKKTAKAKTAK
jgi:topoisomerase IA-like protein